MKKFLISIFVLLAFFGMIGTVGAKEIATECKYISADDNNTVYLEIYTDNSVKAFVKKFNGTEHNGNNNRGNKEDVQNWSNLNTSSCPNMVLVTDGFWGYNVYAGANEAALSNYIGGRTSYAYSNYDATYSADSFFANCTYRVPYASSSFMRFRLEIQDENHATLYYDSDGNYLNTNFAQLLNNVTVYGLNTNNAATVGSTVSMSSVLAAFEQNGNQCPYLIWDGNTLRVSTTAEGDGINSFNSQLEDEEYSDTAPEQEEDPTECVSHYNSNAMPSVQGAEFYWLTYPDGQREFCVRTSEMDSRACSGRFTGNDDVSVTVRTGSGGGMSFYLSPDSMADFYGENCIGNNFYIYEEAGIGAGSYVLTTDEEEAQQGTSYTQGEDGEIDPDDPDNPQQVCDGDNCNISLSGICGNVNVSSTLRSVGIIIIIIKVLVPAIIIVVGIKNLFMIITSGKEDDIKKYAKAIAIRIVIGVIIFLIPGIINFIYDAAQDVIGGGQSNSFDNCWNCLFDIDQCDTSGND